MVDTTKDYGTEVQLFKKVKHPKEIPDLKTYI